MYNEELNKVLKEKFLIVYKYLIKNGCNHHDAEDIVQNCFIKLINNLAGIDIKKVDAWLFRVALNEFYDLCRKGARYPSANVDDGTFLNNLASEEDCEAIIINSLISGQISVVMDNLKPVFKNLLLLKYDMDLSYKEIGALLDINENLVKNYLFRARKQFIKVWEELNYER
ncbi:DNA-directed RNA polymerase sigma-70 factor [Clostridium zeae]|uniref:DNA-directed RNA polymerase sigma-70 factor n=1 Tax=Clostridium zeae TaxID=2759022 RepID=A0ABQ1E9I7_9CLOT|nr:RNA polymerase sigma factor [Clostridium zeae]GFZ31475.1 DNA-directed RNA polymerase sigma-70 factor [Clostridium zeae]